MKQKSHKLQSSHTWEDPASHQACFLPSQATQYSMTFSYNTSRYDFRAIVTEIFQYYYPIGREGTSEVTREDTTEVTTEVTTEGTSEDTTEVTTEVTTEGTTEGTSEDTSEDTTKDTSEDTTKVTSEDTSEETTKDTSEDTTKDTTKDTTEDTTEDTSEKTLANLHTCSEMPICPNRTEYHTAFNNIKNAKSTNEIDLYNRYKSLLLEFIRDVVAGLMDVDPDDLVFQRHPTLRVCFPSDKPMGVPHTDYEYHHMPSEVNIWIPLTDVYDTNTLYVESSPGKGDFKPIELSYGQGFRFWGNKCRHYTVPNQTSTTRVSLDFRVIAKSRFNPNFRDMKGRVGGLFHVGQYYSLSKRSEEHHEDVKVSVCDGTTDGDSNRNNEVNDKGDTFLSWLEEGS